MKLQAIERLLLPSKPGKMSIQPAKYQQNKVLLNFYLLFGSPTNSTENFAFVTHLSGLFEFKLQLLLRLLLS